RKISFSSGEHSDAITDESKIKWSRGLWQYLDRNEQITFDSSKVISVMYRPFTKKYHYYDRGIVEYPGKFSNFHDNLMIFSTGRGISRDYSSLIVNEPVESALEDKGQGFCLYSLSDNELLNHQYNVIRQFGLSEEETFYYVYGVLNSREYRKRYANDLQKSLARIPLLKNKAKYVEIGCKLADLHLNYENQPVWEGIEVEIIKPNYRVKKMKHPKKGVLDTIIYNESITIKNIPEKAYEYVVNGRPAIDWIIDQYQVKTDKKSGITDDPNEFSDNPKYILNLLLSVITVSMRTLELIDELPEFEIQE
ncbi:helicase, partial [Listeria monocytogenes]|nr:helicase [Listeria monocytogenes]